MDLSLIITPIIGGLIGYFTNWLAIKMLFIPRNEKRIFGIKVPFTPGVLPKSKNRIAVNIGNTVGNHLLTEETIKNAIVSADVHENINDMLDLFYDKLTTSNKTMQELCTMAFGPEFRKIRAEIESSIAACIFDQLENEMNQEKAVQYLMDLFGDTLKKWELDQITDFIIQFLENEIAPKSIEYINSESFAALYENFFDRLYEKLSQDERTLKEVISGEFAAKLKFLILNRTPLISEIIIKTLDNETVDEKLTQLVKMVIDDTVGSFIGSLMHKKVYDSIKNSLVTYLSNSENMIVFAESINAYIDLAMKKEIQFFMQKIDYYGNNTEENLRQKTFKLIKNLFAYIDLNQVSTDAVNLIEKKLAEVLNGRNLYEIIMNIKPTIFKDLQLFLMDQFHTLYDQVIVVKIKSFIHTTLDTILKIKISVIVGFIGKTPIEILKIWLNNNKVFILNKISDIILKKLNINEIIEEKINGLDAREMETLVLVVADKELKHITIMGGILGTIIGFVPGLINYFL